LDRGGDPDDDLPDLAGFLRILGEESGSGVPTTVLGRFRRIASAALRTGTGVLKARIRGNEGAGLHAADATTIEQLVLSLGELKGVAMKVGQILSYVDGSVDPEAREFLAVLQRYSQSTLFAQIEQTLQEDLGAQGQALLARLEREPIATASIGQVHRAVMEDGTPVAVKVRHPGIDTAIRLGVLGRDHEDDLVQGIVLMRKGENPGQVIEGVKATAAAVQKRLPAGVELKPYYSRDRLVRTTVATVLRNLIEGAVLVILLLSLFLYNIRAAFIVALTIPLSLLFAFIFMDLRGIPANLLSLGAIDFGIIVDGAVIMTENIVRHLSQRRVTGHRVLREVQHSALEVARPLTFAVLIIMTVYVPILTFQRIEGKLFRPMAVTISLAVIGSLVLTLTLIPVLASLLFRRPPSERESPLLRWIRKPYLPALRWCLRRPVVPLATAAVFLVLSLGLGYAFKGVLGVQI